MPERTSTLPAVYYTPQQVASSLHVHYRTVLDWIARGELAAADISDPAATRSRYVVTQDQLDAFIASRTR